MEDIKQVHEMIKSLFSSTRSPNLYAYATELGILAGIIVGLIVYLKT